MASANVGKNLPQIRIECLADYDATHRARGVRHVASSLGGDGSPQLAHLLENEISTNNWNSSAVALAVAATRINAMPSNN
eukprot:6997597-Lingulodinium_polyedra.AAC.1